MKTLLFYLFFSITVTGCFAQERNGIYEKFFTDPVQDIPFPITKGSSYYSGYQNTLDYINRLSASYPELISVSSIGASQRGYKVPLVIFSKKNNIPEQDKLRVCFLSSVHGDEPISTDGMLYLMDQLSNNDKYSHILDNIILEIIPIVNVDGYIDDKRDSNNGTDLNRNLTILNVVETVNLKNAINKFNPHIVIDFHEYGPARKDFLEIDDCLTSSYDAMFLYTGNLNVNSSIRKVIVDDFVTPTKLKLEQNNRRVTDYLTTTWKDQEVILNIGGNSARSSATNYALQNRISILMEIRGVSEKEKAAKRRIETSFLTALSYLEIAGQKGDLIKAAIQKADLETINEGSDIVLESESEKIDFPFVFVNTCTNEYQTITFQANFNVKQKPLVTRKRPDGYLIVTKSKQIFKILNASGIVYQVVDKPKKIEVETYKQLDKFKFEISNETIEIPMGTIVINEHQKMGNVIIELMEPEEKNSLVFNNLLKPFKGTNKLRVYRINKDQVLQLQNKN